MYGFLVEGDGFEPSKRDATDLQSAPFGHSGTPPNNGAGDGTRTRNLLITNQLLCQLSYTSLPVFCRRFPVSTNYITIKETACQHFFEKFLKYFCQPKNIIVLVMKMLNYVWGGMVLVSLIVAIFAGNTEAVTGGALDGAKAAVETCIGLLGSMCLWTGLAQIARDSGLVGIFAKLMKPVTKILFPKLKQDSPALRAIVLNMVANLLGMGNAATPLGISAMKELDRLNRHKASASDEMCMFVVINTASIQLIPSTVIALRQMYGSAAPSEIIVPVWICSIGAVLVGVISAKIFQKRSRLL